MGRGFCMVILVYSLQEFTLFSCTSVMCFCHSAFSFAFSFPQKKNKTMTTFKGPHTRHLDTVLNVGSPWIFGYQDYPIYLVFDLDMVHLTTLDRKIMGQMVRRRLRHATGASRYVIAVQAPSGFKTFLLLEISGRTSSFHKFTIR